MCQKTLEDCRSESHARRNGSMCALRRTEKCSGPRYDTLFRILRDTQFVYARQRRRTSVSHESIAVSSTASSSFPFFERFVSWRKFILYTIHVFQKRWSSSRRPVTRRTTSFYADSTRASFRRSSFPNNPPCSSAPFSPSSHTHTSRTPCERLENAP